MTNIPIKLGVLVLAGGRGERFHGQKQFFEFQGKPLWQHVYEKVIASMGSEENIVRVGIDVPGGETRSGSVMNGLAALDAGTDRVLIAEAARPLVTVEQLETLLNDDAASTVFVMPLVNTVMRRDGTYLNRDELCELLTPQAFDCPMLVRAYETGKYPDMTDESRIMYEEYGIKAHLIETSRNLYKVTYPHDIEILETLAEIQEDAL